MRARVAAWFALCVLAASLGGCAVVGEIGAAAQPSHVGVPPPDLDAVSVQVPVPLGAPLGGWWLDAEPSAPSVLLLHGVTDSRLQMVARARFLHDAGYGVLLVDLPGHGETADGSHTELPHGGIGFGWPERHAAAAAVGWIKRRRPHTRVGVVGISLGGAAAALAGPALNADALVLESVYPSLRAAVGNRVQRLGPFAPLARRVALGQVRPRLSVPPDSLRPIAALARTDVPVLVLGGADDRSTPPAETRALHAAARDGRGVWIVDGAGHEDLEPVAPDEYRRRVLAFLDATLRRPGPAVHSYLPYPLREGRGERHSTPRFWRVGTHQAAEPEMTWPLYRPPTVAPPGTPRRGLPYTCAGVPGAPRHGAARVPARTLVDNV